MIKLIHILITSIYAFSITGMHVDMHWCSGELASLAINSMHHSGCGCDENEISDSCCADADLYLKVADNHSSQASTFSLQLFCTLTQATEFNITEEIISPFEIIYHATDLPPPDILSWICTYII
jgi:hypothetical protein